MKLLFDQNISFRLVARIRDIFPEALHLKETGLENATDHQIWLYARKNNCQIVTFDADFYDLSLIKGVPPRIIWLRVSNQSTNQIEQILRRDAEAIREFLYNNDYHEIGCLEIFD